MKQIKVKKREWGVTSATILKKMEWSYLLEERAVIFVDSEHILLHSFKHPFYLSHPSLDIVLSQLFTILIDSFEIRILLVSKIKIKLLL